MEEDTDQDMQFGAVDKKQKWNYVELPMAIDKKPVYIRVQIDNPNHAKKYEMFPNSKTFKKIASSKLRNARKNYYFLEGTKAQAKKQPVRKTPAKKTTAKKGTTAKPTRRTKRKVVKPSFGCGHPGRCKFGDPTPLNSFWGGYESKNTQARTPQTTPKKAGFGGSTGSRLSTGQFSSNYRSKFGIGMHPSLSEFYGPYDVSKTQAKIATAFGELQEKFGVKKSSRHAHHTRTSKSRFGCGSSSNRFGLPYGARYGSDYPRY